ncbi:MAG: hypothetical protein KDC43_15870 [Saprospiraceae bacterium]|nr:hypothetical protein [Saprospiraceae bacterium]MCB0625350.1 hypothetical protein [Saprospiraceae bacterium]MCB0683131.1 hypothetical protein [Saprospiraceae bacterium]
MNLRKLKLDLTIALMNDANGVDVLQTARDVLQSFDGVGHYNGLSVVKKSTLDPEHIQRTYALQFDNCTLDLELISNVRANYHTLSAFQLH